MDFGCLLTGYFAKNLPDTNAPDPLLEKGGIFIPGEHNENFCNQAPGRSESY
jgi:hypothetical protein